MRYIIHQTSDAGDKIEAIREISDSNVKYSENLNLSEIIRKSVFAERSLLDRNQIHLELEIAADLPTIRGHEKQLEIVFSNLIKNAAEALGTMEGRADRSIRRFAPVNPTDSIMLYVKDSGPGIKPENLGHLFKPYFAKGAHGTGIGLYLCRQIVQAHGGTIEVASKDGAGATFPNPASHWRMAQFPSPKKLGDP